VAWVATTIGEYGSTLLPNLECPIQVTATLAILLFALVQQLGVASGSSSQKLLSLAKAVAFLALVAACILLEPEVVVLPETQPLEKAFQSPLSGAAFGTGIAG
jgi:APA family basic amino acid/polyamine antiporter